MKVKHRSWTCFICLLLKVGILLIIFFKFRRRENNFSLSQCTMKKLIRQTFLLHSEKEPIDSIEEPNLSHFSPMIEGSIKNLKRFLYDRGVQSCAMEGREYPGFLSNQSLHQQILLMNTSSSIE